MMLFDRYSLHRQLSILLLAPLAALFILAVISIVQVWNERQTIVHAQGLIELTVAATDVLHLLQNEAGLSVGFVASHGEHFRQHLRGQRLEVDKAAQALQDRFHRQQQAGLFHSRNPLPVEMAISALDKLQIQLRYPVDNLSIPPTTVLSAYSAIDEQLIDLAEMLSRESDTALASQDVLALASFTKSKEKAATERAMLLNAHLSDGLRTGEVRALKGLIAKQDAYTDSFLTLADTSARERYADMIASPAFDKVFEYRSIALEQTKARKARVEPLTWWYDKVAKLDRLRQFEKQLTADVASAANRQLGALHQQLLAICALNLLVVIASGFSGRVVRCTLVRRLGADPYDLSEVACRIANYDFRTDFAAYGCQSGSVMHDIQTMQRLLLEKHGEIAQPPEPLAQPSSKTAAAEPREQPSTALRRSKCRSSHSSVSNRIYFFNR